MTRSVGLSLWLQPSGQLYDELSKTISQLSKKYGAPVFPPHVTLLGDLIGDEKEITSQAQQLASRVQPFQITLTTIDYLDAYFRCLFIRAEETPALLQANRIARSVFHRENDPSFMPHLSLLYANLEVETKQQIFKTIGREWAKAFPVNSIHLLSCDGEPKDWYRVQEFEIPSR
ncbi:MAG: 2'-5' RNA ligase family protein [Chloroflexi bacterium]|nr:2'-5' RNA ligase family protein [Chloroflexota bacterium]